MPEKIHFIQNDNEAIQRAEEKIHENKPAHLSVMDDDERAYLEDHFPRTNDDMLADDYAARRLIEPNEDMEKREHVVKQSREIVAEVDVYITQLAEELKHKEQAIQRQFELPGKIDYLLNRLETLNRNRNKLGMRQLETDTVIGRKMEHIFAQQQAIEDELDRLHREYKDSEAVNEMMKEYEVLYEKLETLSQVWNPIEPRMN